MEYNNVFRDLDEFDQHFSPASKIHIRIQMRNNKKSITTITGLSDYIDDVKSTLKAMRKMFNTNGTVIDDDEFGVVVQLQGDMRDRVKNYLESQNIHEDNIVVYGA